VLRRLALRLAALLLLSTCSVVAGTQTAGADLPVQCSRGSSYNPRTGKCVIAVTPHPPERTDPGTQRQSGSQPVTSNAERKCVSSYSGKEVPCKDGDSWWSNDRDCYVSLADPQPPKSDPQWEGHRTGAIYECYSPALVGSRMYTFWSATSPAGRAAPPDPRVLALRAIATMRLRAIGIGIVPEARAGSIGIVGRRGCGSQIRVNTRGVRSLRPHRLPGTA
jgi:hypothetical protein